jgi:hypothetical protein
MGNHKGLPLHRILQCDNMNENKSSISQANSYLEIGEFWDNHDVTDYWEQTKPVDFEVDIQSEGRYCAIRHW